MAELPPTSRIPVARPFFGPEEELAVAEVLRTGWVTQGPQVIAFEKEFAEFVGSPYACAVSSCTAALHIALLALGVGQGDEVITASHSFIATANAIRYSGATPVFVDIDPSTFNLTGLLIEAAITSRTRAILCVHQLGMPCDLEAIAGIARKRGIGLIEDAACAIGSEVRSRRGWERIGRPWGDIACFSFHPRKLVTTGDGGMLTTRNPEFDHRFRALRQHGMSTSDLKRHESAKVAVETYDTVGYNYRMTDIQAAVGRAQLRRLPAILEERRAQAGWYRELFVETPVILPTEPEWARSNWQSFCVRLPEGVSQVSVMQSLLDAGISTRRGVMCAHREPAYLDTELRFPLPESERAQDQGLILPLFPGLTRRQISSVVDAVLKACRP